MCINLSEQTLAPMYGQHILFVDLPFILLMEEILHHLGCIEPLNHGIFIISTGAGFLPSIAVSGNDRFCPERHCVTT